MDPATFIDQCRAALGKPDPQGAVADLVRVVVSRPGWVERQFMPEHRVGLRLCHRSTDLTVYCNLQRPDEVVPPHDHQLWAVTGLSSGVEENTLYVRDGDDQLQPDRIVTLKEGDVAAFDVDVIHSSRCPGDRFTTSIHVYGGDLFQAMRSVWDAHGSNRRPIPVIPPAGPAETMRALADARRADT
jgi:predicted metal-dependent enzyme (double-stranded beta helix superfamily)